jgi:single-stranded-DNA-specific exonuclease
MTTNVTNWIYKQPDAATVEVLMQRLTVSRPVAEVLVNRGITTVAAATAFLQPDMTSAANPFLLPDIIPAITRIRKAMDAGEKILVYGDRDVDGVTSICVMVRTLASLGVQPMWYIPSDEGYGVHTEIIDRYVAQGITLIITVDCGISAVAEAAFAREKGVDMVITDHHEPPASGMPLAVAVVDPKRADSRYPFTDLAGCAVSFKVAEALMRSFGKYYEQDLVFFAAEPARVAAVRVRNGLRSAEFYQEGPQAFDDLHTFAAGSRLVGAGAAAGKQNEAGEIIDVLAMAHAAVPATAGSLEDLVAALGIPAEVTTVRGRAVAVSDCFHAIDRREDLRMNFFHASHLDAVTLGTIADIMPLVNENRVLVKHGLARLAQSTKVGVLALLERCVKNRQAGTPTAKAISWNITPVLNAAGRRGKADLAANLLLTDDWRRAQALLDEIVTLNDERRELQAENLEKFRPLLLQQCDVDQDKLFLVAATGIEHGVTGIIAAQIMRQYKRPTILLIIEGDQAMGAARSIEGFDMVGALEQVSDLLIKYGGHNQAAGLTVETKNLDELRRRLKLVADERITHELLAPAVHIDSDLAFSDLTRELLAELDALEPYGMGNPLPVFSVRGVKVMEHGRVGADGSHLKLRVGKNGAPSLQAMGWGMGDREDDISQSPVVDLAVQLEINTWQDRQNVQLIILDIKPA